MNMDQGSLEEPTAADRSSQQRPTGGLFGQRLVELAENRRAWTARRIDQIYVIDDKTSDRISELHLNIHDSRFASDLKENVAGGKVLLPVATLKRFSRAAITVRDGSGTILPRVARSTERSLVAAGIATIGGAVDHGLYTTVRRIINTENGSYLRDGTAVRDAVRDQLESHFLRLEKDGVDESILDRVEEEVCRYLEAHLLLAAVPAEALDGPFVLQISYAQSLPPKLREGWLRRFLGGTLSVGFRFELPGVVSADSYHCSVIAPGGFRVQDFEMTVNEVFASGGGATIVLLDDDPRLDVAHSFYSADPKALTTTTASVKAAFYSNWGGFLSESLIIATLTSILLIVYSWRFHGEGYGFDGNTLPVSEQFSASLLLLLPAFAITVVTQRDQHRMASRVFALHRFLLLVVVVAAIAASIPIALKFDREQGRQWWWTCCIVGWGVSARIVFASLIHAGRISEFYVRAKRRRQISRRDSSQTESQGRSNGTVNHSEG